MGPRGGSVLTSTRRTISTTTAVSRELGTAHRQGKERANRDHRSLSTTKIVKNTLVVSVPRDDVAKQSSGVRNTEHSVYASLTQSKEELASMVISDAETGW